MDIPADDVEFSVRWYLFEYPHQIPGTCSAGSLVHCTYDLADLPSGTVFNRVDIYVIPEDRIRSKPSGFDYGGKGKTGRRYEGSVGPIVIP